MEKKIIIKLIFDKILISPLIDLIISYISDDITYLFFNKCIRNDGCFFPQEYPTCRRFYLSLHNSREEALEMALKEGRFENMDDENDEDYMELKKQGSVWVDEWLRKNNGDRYIITSVTSNKSYNTWSIDFDICAIELNNIEYALVHIYFDKNIYNCPHNMDGNFSLHTSFESAYEYSLQFVEKKYKNKLKNMEGVWIEDYKEVSDNENYEEVSDNEEYEKANKGDFYQIIKIEYNKLICLNDFFNVIL